MARNLYALGDNRRVIRVDVSNLSNSTQLSGSLPNSLSFTDGGLTSHDGDLYALSSDISSSVDGRRLVRINLANLASSTVFTPNLNQRSGERLSALASHSDKLYVIYNRGYIIIYNIVGTDIPSATTVTGTISGISGTFVEGMTSHSGNLYIVTRTGRIIRLNLRSSSSILSTNTLAGTLPLGGASARKQPVGLASHDGSMYVVTFEGGLFRVNSSNISTSTKLTGTIPGFHIGLASHEVDTSNYKVYLAGTLYGRMYIGGAEIANAYRK